MTTNRQRGGAWGRTFRLAAGAALAAAGVVACASSLESIGTFPCADDGSCPDGWECRDDACVDLTPSNLPDAGTAARECETHESCGNNRVCVSIVGGGTGCRDSCTGMPDGCTGGDCKLVLSGVETDTALVPACTSYGAVDEDQTCGSVSACVKGYTCAASYYDSSKYVCAQMCNNFNTACLDISKTCKWSVDGYPTDWGLCRP